MTAYAFRSVLKLGRLTAGLTCSSMVAIHLCILAKGPIKCASTFFLGKLGFGHGHGAEHSSDRGRVDRVLGVVKAAGGFKVLI